MPVDRIARFSSRNSSSDIKLTGLGGALRSSSRSEARWRNVCVIREKLSGDEALLASSQETAMTASVVDLRRIIGLLVAPLLSARGVRARLLTELMV